MSEYQVSAVACYVASDVEADDAESAIEERREEIKNALQSGKFELTEIEAESVEGNDWDMWEL